jgi:hypothetical protein
MMITTILLSFFPFFSILLDYLQTKANTKKKCHQGSSNTSGNKNLKEALLIIINSRAYHPESLAKYQPGTNLAGQASQPASCSITRCMHRGVKTPINMR